METVALLGIVAALAAVWLKGIRPEFGIAAALAGAAVILAYGLSGMSGLAETVNGLQSRLPVEPVYLRILFKLAGISFLAEFSSNICRDAGCAAMGSQIELFGKLSMLAAGLPVILALFETLDEWL